MTGIWIAKEKAVPRHRVFVRGLVIALGVVIAAHTSTGISYAGPGCLGEGGWGTLALVVVLLTIFNMFLKPILVLFALPFVVLTLGLGLWFINAFLFLLVAKLVPGFVVMRFRNALWGAFVVSIMSILANRWLYRRPRRVTRILGGISTQPRAARRDDDVIDV